MYLIDIKKVPINRFHDSRGFLGVLEEMGSEFNAQRIYWLDNFLAGTIRGEHAHRNLNQILIQIRGRCEILLDDSVSKEIFILDQTSEYGIFVPRGIWRSIKSFSNDSLLMVVANMIFDPNDYLNTYEEFINWRKKT